MANEKRLIDLDKAFGAINQEVWWTESEKAYFRSFLAKQPKVDAVEVVYCDECKSHGSCIPEDTFRWMRIEKPYCCVGKRKTNTNFDAKMDGDGNG